MFIAHILFPVSHNDDDTVFIRLRELLKNEDWDFIQELNINAAFIQLHNILRNNIETLAPEKNVCYSIP